MSCRNFAEKQIFASPAPKAGQAMQAASAPDYKLLYEQSQLEMLQLEQQLQQLQKMTFGSRHERFVPSSVNDPQLSLPMELSQQQSSR